MEERSERTPTPRKLNDRKMLAFLKKRGSTAGSQRREAEMKAMELHAIQSVGQKFPHLANGWKDSGKVVEVRDEPGQPPDGVGVVQHNGLVSPRMTPVLGTEDHKHRPGRLAGRMKRERVGRKRDASSQKSTELRRSQQAEVSDT